MTLIGTLIVSPIFMVSSVLLLYVKISLTETLYSLEIDDMVSPSLIVTVLIFSSREITSMLYFSRNLNRVLSVTMV